MENVSVLYAGTVLNDLFTVTDVTRPVMGAPEVVSEIVPGRDGVALKGIRREPIEVLVTLAALGSSAADVRTAFSSLASLLAASPAPRKLAFSDDSGWYYLAVPSAAGDIENLGVVNGGAEIGFTATDAIMHHDRQPVTVRANGSAVAAGSTIGTATIDTVLDTPALLRVRTTAAGTTSLMDETGETWTADATGAGYLFIDARTRSVGFSTSTTGTRTVKMLSLSCDWPWLSAGEHTFTALSANIGGLYIEYEGRRA